MTPARLSAPYVPDIAGWDLPSPPSAPKRGSPNLGAAIEAARERSWLWCSHATVSGRLRVLVRAWVLRQWELPRLCRAFSAQTAIAPDALLAAYVPGSFPWVWFPNDIDVAFILRGNSPWATLQVARLGALRVLFPSVQSVNIEHVGFSCLQRAVRGEDVPKDVVIRRKAIAYWGAIFLHGHDIFAGSRPPDEAFHVMISDLLINARLCHWPETILRSAARTERKKRWRQAEVNALTAWLAEDR